MTPAQVEQAARRRYNAENSTFWAQDELFKIIWEGEQLLATEALAIEAKDTSTSTVVGTQAYSYPSLFISIKRIEYNGAKLQPIDFRDDDSLTLSNSITTSQGTPQYYYIWNSQIYLRPIPDAIKTLTIYGYKEATLLTAASSSLSTPTICHSALINYCAALLAAKDENDSKFNYFMGMWNADVERLKRWAAKKKRRDGYAVVKDEESLAGTLIGAV